VGTKIFHSVSTLFLSLLLAMMLCSHPPCFSILIRIICLQCFVDFLRHFCKTVMELSCGISLDLYSGRCGFVSRLRHRLYWSRVSLYFSVPLGKCHNIRPWSLPYKFSCNSSFISRLTIRRYTVQTGTASYNDPPITRGKFNASNKARTAHLQIQGLFGKCRSRWASGLRHVLSSLARNPWSHSGHGCLVLVCVCFSMWNSSDIWEQP
jgi:hypothetical protein